MGSYARAVQALQPVLPILFDAFAAGLSMANVEHAQKGYRRGDDEHLFAAVSRREVMEQLKQHGLLVLKGDGDRPAFPMSALVLNYEDLIVWIRKATRTGIRDRARSSSGGL